MQNSEETYTDHLGVVRDVHTRNDITVNPFSTGAFAPGVTVNVATYRMWAIDAGIKYNRLAIKIDRAPYSGAFTAYTAGMTGWVPMVQTVLAF